MYLYSGQVNEFSEIYLRSCHTYTKIYIYKHSIVTVKLHYDEERMN